MANVVRRPNPESMRWEQAPEMQSLSALMDRFLEGWGDMPQVVDGAFVPVADLEETDDAYIIEVELPGVNKKDIDVSLSGRRLTIAGERKEKERTGVLRRRVRSMGKFRYEVLLPGDVDDGSVEAKLDDGVLTVRIAKRSGEKQRHVEIK
jgi:HSP20 family protein